MRWQGSRWILCFRAARQRTARFFDDASRGEIYRTVRAGDEVFDIWCAPLSSVSAGSAALIRVATNVTAQADAQEKLRRQADYLSSLNEQVLEKNQMLEALSAKLSKYLSPHVYSSIFSGTQSVEISAQRKKLTVFFSDIASFTETTDKLESEELTRLLNRYLTEMSDIALKHGATIDKYVGDAIVVFFGDPETRGVSEDDLACVRMAIEMQDRMRVLAEYWRDRGIEYPLKCRIGINTGYCTVGNFGSKDRMDYTIIGGGVNLAARLETMAVPGEILLSFEIYAHIKNEIHCEKFGQLEVKGMAYPVSTYKVAVPETKPEILVQEGRNFELRASFSSMSPDQKKKVEAVLKTALARLSNGESD